MQDVFSLKADFNLWAACLLLLETTSCFLHMTQGISDLVGEECVGGLASCVFISLLLNVSAGCAVFCVAV